MRPLRLLLSLSSSLIAATLLLYVLLAPAQPALFQQQANARKQGGFKALLSFTSPGSLFPPSAIISLTDDNSTFFLARPAAFGPTLPADGLSSALWVGSGFGDDSLGKGELGCGDTPDWARHEDQRKPESPSDTGHGHKGVTRAGSLDDDIQSLQESAEIDGKVVLLKRGQCGFLAKVLWAQRRGAVAVIVGDNVRGGALIRMYAKDDTSNVTIPSIFTSHTTAHLLSSLLPGDASHHLSSSTETSHRNVSPGRGEHSDKPGDSSHQTAWWVKWFGSSAANVILDKSKTSSDRSAPHKGLWVTLTPTNVSTSPFFDTLLVLVVSPLVTLTVVYALLLLRSRIRRRRWRAPKSLVERLPVRTYQTISDSTTSATPSAASPTTPLLHHSPIQSSSPMHSSRSVSDEEGPATPFANRETNRAREEEKRESGLAEWRRRYGGRQKECVVCLDEYVDGVSQVMSLPCGHEFHADCITPWLVTRRRTCPICKGDVVRSLAQSHHDRLPSSSPTRPTRLPDNEDDVQAQAAEIRNDSPSASLPMPISASAPVSRSQVLDEDVEANWSGDESGPASRSRPSNSGIYLSTSFRDLSSTVSTVIWHGVEAVRNTTSFQRRPPEVIDRDR